MGRYGCSRADLENEYRRVLGNFAAFNYLGYDEAAIIFARRSQVTKWGSTVGFEAPGTDHEGLQDAVLCGHAFFVLNSLNDCLIETWKTTSVYGLKPAITSPGSLKRLFGFGRKKEKESDLTIKWTVSDSNLFHTVWAEETGRICTKLELVFMPDIDPASLDDSHQAPILEQGGRHNVGNISVFFDGPVEDSPIVNSLSKFYGMQRMSDGPKHVSKGFIKLKLAYELYHRTPVTGDLSGNTVGNIFFASDMKTVLLDPEESPIYANINPGTVTVEGYGLEYWNYEEVLGEPREPSFVTKRDYLPIDHIKLLRAYNLVHKGKPMEKRPKGGEVGLIDVMEPSDFEHFDTRDKVIQKMWEIRDLTDILSCETSWVDFSLTPGVTNQLSSVEIFWKILWQMILTIQLANRYHLGDHARFESGRSMKADKQLVASLMIAKQWVKNVELLQTGKPISELKPKEFVDQVPQIRSTVRERQILILITFAQDIKWPFIQETHQYLKTLATGEEKVSVGKLSSELHDWLLGLTLAGKFMSVKLMASLVQSTPSLSSLKFTDSYDIGLLLEERSYWREWSVVGRVLGGLPGIFPVCGWIEASSHPQVEGADKPQFIILKSKRIKPKAVEGDRGGSAVASLFGHSKDYWMNGEESPEGRAVPEAPKDGAKAELLKIALEKETGEEGSNPEYQAKAAFEINGKAVAYTLTTTPVFITLPRCFTAASTKSHEAYSWEIEQFDNIWSIERLDEIPESETTIIINATGGPGAETLARAWCAAKGKNAVVRHKGGACFTCAVRNAGSKALATGVVIWAS